MWRGAALHGCHTPAVGRSDYPNSLNGVELPSALRRNSTNDWSPDDPTKHAHQAVEFARQVQPTPEPHVELQNATQALAWTDRDHITHVLHERRRSCEEAIRLKPMQKTWLKSLPRHAQRVIQHVHLPLWERMAAASDDPDYGFLMEIKNGGVALVIPASKASNTVPVDEPDGTHITIYELVRLSAAVNQRLLRESKPDELAGTLFDKIKEEVRAGKLEVLGLASEVVRCDKEHVLSRRFGIRQETVLEDGSIREKVRAIDDMKESFINHATRVFERIRHDAIDDILSYARRVLSTSGQQPFLVKADFEAAYRNIPICEEHLRFAQIVCFGSERDIEPWNVQQ